MEKQTLDIETNLNDIKLDSTLPKGETTIKDLFENASNSNQNLESKNKP